jgi:flagellar assembly protein FliH
MPSPKQAPPATATQAAEPFVFSTPYGNGSTREAGPRSSAPPPVGADSQAERQSYERGLAEGEARVRAASEKSLESSCAQMAKVLREFAAERNSYFQRVEAEVVQLALSIARKILHREAQIDPLLLTGIVRVALENLNQGTRVRLHAHPQDISFWRDYLSCADDLAAALDLLGDPALEPGSCLLETDLGSTLISLDTQLKEIEQGFLDLLERRPQVRE